VRLADRPLPRTDSPLPGRPDESGGAGGAKPYAYLGYVVEYRDPEGSSAQESLFIEFDKTGRAAVWVRAPDEARC
jgi:hypothetical protein